MTSVEASRGSMEGGGGGGGPVTAAPRYEAFVMTGSHILPAGRVSRANLRQDKSRSKVQATNNIVLRSPVLSGGRSASPTENSPPPLPPTPPPPAPLHSPDDKVIFQYRTYDVHEFHLTRPETPQKESSTDSGKPEDSSNSVRPVVEEEIRVDLEPDRESRRLRALTPEIVDDRPVWTVNAPVSTLHSKSLPGSPSPRRTAQPQRFREILREETIITDTTISEVTDTNTSTSYILNSPRTHRHQPEEPPKVVSDLPVEVEQVQVDPVPESENPSAPEMVVVEEEEVPVAPPPLPSVLTPVKEPKKGETFVHPESARACMEVFFLEGMKLDEALRVFLSQVKLVGETEARQRVIDLFSMRYVECNPQGLFTRDSTNGAVSGMLILNSDLYSQHRPQRPMNLANFIQSLWEIPACADLPEEELRHLFQSIKNERLPVARGKDGEMVEEYVDEAVAERGASYKLGYLLRKSCLEAGGKATRWGSRGWHRFFVVLNDMSLELYKKEPVKDSPAPFLTIPLHHGYAKAASDYRKHPWVLRFRAIDSSVSLFRAVNRDELEAWLRSINTTAALNSAPVSLPVGSQTMAQTARQPSLRPHVRPLYASGKSGLSSAEQVAELKQGEGRLLREIQTLNTEEPASRKEVLFMSAQLDFFNQELERTQAYLAALTGKL